MRLIRQRWTNSALWSPRSATRRLQWTVSCVPQTAHLDNWTGMGMRAKFSLVFNVSIALNRCKNLLSTWKRHYISISWSHSTTSLHQPLSIRVWQIHRRNLRNLRVPTIKQEQAVEEGLLRSNVCFVVIQAADRLVSEQC